MDKSLLPFYEERITLLTRRLKRLNRQINGFSVARLLMILIGGALLFVVVQTEIVWLTLLTFFLVLFAFVWLVARQSKLTKEKEDVEDDLLVVKNEQGCLAGELGMYDAGEQFIDDKHPYSSDLDLFGQKSIYHKINRAITAEGRKTLAQWLSVAGQREVLTSRQVAVKELASEPLWCLDTLARLVFCFKTKGDFKATLVNYLQKPYGDFGNNFLHLYTKVSPFLILGAIIGSYFISGLFLKIAAFLIIGNILFTMAYAGKISIVADGIGRMGDLLVRFARVFRNIEHRAWQNELIGTMCLAKGKIAGSHHSISDSINELGKLINKLDYRLNMLVSAFLNGIFLWDFRQVFALIEWRQKHRYEMAEVFDELAQLEALLSFALLHMNQPDWSWPNIIAGEKQVFAATRLQHPLIPASISVANDYALKGHRIALITGSNMAGKSTFLRTVGANIVLALSGAPVCAASLEVSIVHLVSYMRIKDSLNESTSTFKAELNRLEMILQTVAKQRSTFFLVDEMLRGTNSVDKYLGSKAVIEKLIKDEGVGMLATHDLQLAVLEETYADYLKNYHFDIQVISGEMIFDYRLKKGACTIFNASMLLKKIGIDISV